MCVMSTECQAKKTEIRKLALKHNRHLREGVESIGPDLIMPVDEENKMVPSYTVSRKLKQLLDQLNDFEIVFPIAWLTSREDLIALKHQVCNKISYYRIDVAGRNLRSSEGLHCQNRKCFEKATGLTLGANAQTPSRKGKKAGNRITDLKEQVSILSEGTLSIQTSPEDVRSEFTVKVLRGIMKGYTVTISSHDNWLRRSSYQKLATLILSGDLWPKSYVVSKPESI